MSAALILNGAGAQDDLTRDAAASLQGELVLRGQSVMLRDLARLEIPDCQGDFGCWTVLPGICVQPGPHRDLARDLIRSELVAWLTPVTFGGYSSILKGFLDHCIPLVSPHFTTIEGETHHKARYDRFPSLLVIGVMERPDPESTRVFERLVRRNALNMHAPRFAARVLTRAELPALPALIPHWLDDLAASGPPHAGGEPLELGAAPGLPLKPARRALLLVGSPRGSTSVSANLARHLEGLLGARGIEVTTESIRHQRQVDPGLRGLCSAVRAADVVALAAPLYVDSLPAPVIAVLEGLARDCASAPSPPRFLAMINSGFPESVQSGTALAICRRFTREAGLDWIGGLAIGAGGMLEGKPLADQGGRARHVTRALALAANAIAAGQVLPEEAQRLVRRLPIPAALYRFLGDWGFRREAKRWGTRARLDERPYAPSPPPQA